MENWAYLTTQKPTFCFQPRYHLALDYKTRIFQNLAGAKHHVYLTNDVEPSQYWLYNNVTGEYPMIIHGNGPSKVGLVLILKVSCPSFCLQNVVAAFFEVNPLSLRA